MKINDPRFNLRELVKQLILLEQHLLEKGKYCPDCITKHLLTIEGLADEGQCLDTDQSLCAVFETLRTAAQRWCSMYSRGISCVKIGQEVRQIRKRLAQHVLDPNNAAAPAELAGLPSLSGGSGGSSSWLVLLGVAGAAVWWAQKQHQVGAEQ